MRTSTVAELLNLADEVPAYADNAALVRELADRLAAVDAALAELIEWLRDA